ncbi:MAG TPA: hypothetical protein VLF90_02425 [Patescibacteria group bacterium]|nr:hypothetical protein [Patescibacteria group bacterium]
MTPPKNFWHDRIILLLLTISAFLVALGTVLILLKFNPGQSESYIVQYRQNLGISAFKVGHTSDVLAFIVFLLMVAGLNVFLSLRVYRIHRQFSVTILGLGVLLLTLAIIVSNALLVLR